MKKTLLSILILMTFSLIANEEDKSFSYTGIGAGAAIMYPLPVPCISLGHREVGENSAVDMRVSFATIGVISGASLELQGLSYKENNTYLGGGLGAGISFNSAGTMFSVSPFMSAGKDKEFSFQEVGFSFVSFSTAGILISPCVSYTYGFKF